MQPIAFHSLAHAEVRDAGATYLAIREDLGNDFREELRAAIERVRSNPEMYAVVAKRYRLAPLRRFPYSLVYEIHLDQVWVVAFAHHSRHPKYWARRKLE